MNMASKVLVVEDDAALGRVLQDNLTFEGFQVMRAVDGHTALDVFREHSPELVILDLNLPDVDGLELVELFRRAGPTPIILLTARSQKKDKLQGLQLGADD
jgi:DNA-binding response OmpR family regulator